MGDVLDDPVGVHEGGGRAAAASARRGEEEEDNSSDDDSKYDPDQERGLYFDGCVWDRIRGNDPSARRVHISFSTEYPESFAVRLNWESGGEYFKANTNLKKLSVTNLEEDEGDGNGFLRGLVGNRSIKELCFLNCRFAFDGSMVSVLQSLVESNTSLDRLQFEYCKMYGGNWSTLARALSSIEQRSLKQFSFSSNEGVTKESFGDIIASLKGHKDLSRLALERNFHHSLDVAFPVPKLKDLLQSPWCKVKDLNLGRSKISGEGLEALVAVLSKTNSLKRLTLRDEHVGSRTWQAFCSCFQNPNCALERLSLIENNLSNEDAASLGKALADNKTLRFLDMSFNLSIRSRGWAAFFPCLQGGNSALEELDLSDNRISDHFNNEGMAALAHSLQRNEALRYLNMRGNDTVGPAGWRGIATALQSSALNLDKIDLHNCGIDDGSVTALANGLAANSKLKALILSGNFRVTFAGWGAFFRRMQSSRSVLETLILEDNHIGDESVPELVALLGNVSSLKVLNLSSNDITSFGLPALASMIRAPNCMLEELRVDDNPLTDDDTLIAFAHAVAHNKTMSKFIVADNRLLENEVNERLWEAFSDVLCNRESIEGIYSSNHTLQMICDESDEGSILPDYLQLLLELNRNNTKHEAARQKILRFHICINNRTNLDAFVGMELTVLPVAMAWIGRDDVGRSALYQLCRTLPSLFGTNGKAVSAGLKRKRA